MITPALYLIPTTLGDTPSAQVFPPVNHDIIIEIKHFIVEEVRTARRFLKFIDKSIDINSITFYPMGKHSDSDTYAQYLQPIRQGQAVGMLSEAGCPAVADPGSTIVAIAQKESIKVVPLVGPSSILLALMASGMNGQSFAFNGYMPINENEMQHTLRRLETRAVKERQTQIFIEAPFRNKRFIESLLKTLSPSTRLCIAAGLTCENEYIRTQTVARWRSTEIPDLSHTPAIFCIGA